MAIDNERMRVRVIQLKCNDGDEVNDIIIMIRGTIYTIRVTITTAIT